MMPTACNTLSNTPTMEVQTSFIDEDCSALSTAKPDAFHTGIDFALGEYSDNFFQLICTIAAKGGGRFATNLGKAGEKAVQNAFNIGKKSKILVNGRTRIPDGMTRSVLSEVKNVKSLSYTQQLRDFAKYAGQTGRQFDLYVRPTTTLSGPLQNAIKNGIINLNYIP